MIYSLNAPMFDFLVLSVLRHQDAYGYQLSQTVKKVSNSRDSTLYPVLRRLLENGWVEAYDQPFQGRNRRYYHITETGRQHQRELLQEWEWFQNAIREIVSGEDSKGQGRTFMGEGKESDNEQSLVSVENVKESDNEQSLAPAENVKESDNEQSRTPAENNTEIDAKQDQLSGNGGKIDGEQS